MKNLFYIILAAIFLSCSNNKEEQEQEVIDLPTSEKNFLTKTKDIFIDSEEIKNERKLTYLEDMNKKYSDYKLVLEFFQILNNVYIVESNGDLYKIIDSQIDDAGSKVYKYEEKDVLRYLYKTKENFYIYNFSIEDKNQVKCIGVRRIGDGMFKTAMHDLVFEDNKLTKEDFKGEFSTKFFIEKDNQYFRFSNKVNGDKVINTLNLGPVKDF